VNRAHLAAPPAARLIEQSTLLRNLALVLLFGALTALSAQIRWYRPGNPVPITAQVFAVLLSGALLGGRLGAASQLTYIGFGLLGAPVFAGGLGARATLLGPTGGYLAGFVLAAAIVGFVTQRDRRPMAIVACMAAGLGVIYLFGAGWLVLWTHLTQAMPWPEAIAQGVTLGVAPFLIPDAFKVALATLVARRALQ
jgi:biotin transport system substrate-specific component